MRRAKRRRAIYSRRAKTLQSPIKPNPQARAIPKRARLARSTWKRATPDLSYVPPAWLARLGKAARGLA